MTDAELMYHIRKKLYLNQTEMAKEVGYNSQDAISKIETGDRKLSGPARRCLELFAEKHNIEL